MMEKSMDNKTIGIDSFGNWTPQQYAIDNGWSYEAVHATALNGVSPEDRKDLTPDQQVQLLSWCLDQLATIQGRDEEREEPPEGRDEDRE
jgi:hypothetical protein